MDCVGVMVEQRLYQRKVHVDMLNVVKNVLANISLAMVLALDIRAILL